jgi:hypothetical protein
MVKYKTSTTKDIKKRRWMAILKNNIDKDKFAKKTKDNKECNIAEFIKKVIDSKSYVYNKEKVLCPVQSKKSHIQFFNKKKRQKEKKQKKKKRKREKRIAKDNFLLKKRNKSNEIAAIDFTRVFDNSEDDNNQGNSSDCNLDNTYERNLLQTRNDNSEANNRDNDAAAFLMPLQDDNSDDDMSIQNDGNNSEFFFNFNYANTEENVLQLDEVNLLSNEVLGELMSVQEMVKKFGKDSPTSVQQLPHTS